MAIHRIGTPGAVLTDAVPGQRQAASVAELNERAREVLRQVVESYVETGEPVGSRALTRKLTEALSPATIRNIMADLQDLGLLYAPHTSAGRLPTDAGLRLFVNGLLEVGNLSEEERESIEARCAAAGRSVNEALEQATTLLSGLSRCASLVMAPKTEQPLKHIEFVNLGPGRALVVTVTQSGQVENRLIDTPVGMPPSALVEATNYLNARLIGRTFEEARRLILEDLKLKRAELNDLTARVIESGLATWAGEPGGDADRARPGAAAGGHHRDRRSRARARAVRCAGARRELRAPARARQRGGAACRSSSAPTIRCSPTPAARWWWRRSAIRRNASWARSA